MTKKTPEKIDDSTQWINLAKGLSIYLKPKKSKNWYVYIDQPEKGIKRLHKSLRLNDQQLAQRKAYALLDNVENKQYNDDLINTVKPLSYYSETVINKIIAAKEQRKTTSDNQKYINGVNDFVAYFGDMPANRLTTDLLDEYFVFKKFKSMPPWRYSNKAIKEFIKILMKERLLDPYDPPEYMKFTDSLSIKDRRRDIFEEFELKIILKELEDYKNKPSKNKKTRENRLIFYYLCHFLLHSGMRHGTEVHGICWEDIKTTEKHQYKTNLITMTDKNSYVIYLYAGKTTKIHDVFPLSMSAATILRDFAKERCKGIIGSSHSIGSGSFEDLKTYPGIVGLNGPIFARWDKSLPIFWDVWDDFYQPIKSRMRKTAKHSLYSFRHTFIDNLMYNYDIQKVAYLARTSPEMIFKFYSKHDAMKSADQKYIDS
jgi:hypothetical protein